MYEVRKVDFADTGSLSVDILAERFDKSVAKGVIEFEFKVPSELEL